MGCNINCKDNNQGVWCKNKNVKRSLFGIGARCCLVFNGKPCPYREKYLKPPYKVVGQS